MFFSEAPWYDDDKWQSLKSVPIVFSMSIIFRLLHRIIASKKELLKFRITDDATCPFCLNSDSIEHTFLDCSEITSFYSEALVWFNRANDTEVNLSNKEQITFDEIPEFHQLSEYPRRRLHLFVILLKQYVYSCKCFEKKPIQKEFETKMLMQWQIEKCAPYLFCFSPP